MADNDDQHDDTQDSNLVRDLRKQLKDANKELGELRPLRTEKTLRNLGIDPDSKDTAAAKQAKALLALHGDGEQTPEALRKTAEEYGISLPDPDAEAAPPPDPVAEQRSETIQRVDALREGATPVGSQTLTPEQTRELQQHNPAAAVAAMREGKAQLPAQVMEAVLANRAERAQQLG